MKSWNSLTSKQLTRLKEKVRNNSRHGNASGNLITSLRKQGKTPEEINEIVKPKINTITKENINDIWNKQKGRCADTNYLINADLLFEKRHPFAPSIDRINNSKGYEPGNIRIVLAGISWFRGNMKYSEWIKKRDRLFKYIVIEDMKRHSR